MSLNEYELLIVPRDDMANLINKNTSINNLLVSQRDKYLIHLSDKYINMPIRQIIRNDKQYFMENDRSAKQSYIICFNNKRPVGFCKVIEFGKDIRNIDFFQPLLRKYDLSHSIYVYSVFVLESERGKGICSAMLKYIVSYIKDNNITTAIADIKKDNYSSIKCFTTHGFVKTGIASRGHDIQFFSFTNKKTFEK